MISSKSLMRMARKWQKMAAIDMERVSPAGTRKRIGADSCGKPFVSDKGHFVFYTTDQRRFPMPLTYTSNDVFRELFRMSAEDFGLACDGPMTLPCEAVFRDYTISLIQRGIASVEKALIDQQP